MIVEFRIIKKNEPLMIWAHSLNSIYNKKYTLFYGGIQGEISDKTCRFIPGNLLFLQPDGKQGYN